GDDLDPCLVTTGGDLDDPVEAPVHPRFDPGVDGEHVGVAVDVIPAPGRRAGPGPGAVRLRVEAVLVQPVEVAAGDRHLHGTVDAAGPVHRHLERGGEPGAADRRVQHLDLEPA